MSLSRPSERAALPKDARTPPLNFRTAKGRALRAAIYKRDLFTCQFCGWMPNSVPYDYDGSSTIGPWAPFDADRILHVDHIVPRCVGGPNVLSNLRTLCEPCNVSRGARGR